MMKEIERPDRSGLYCRDVYTREEIELYKLTPQELEEPGALPDITIYAVVLNVIRKVMDTNAFCKTFRRCTIEFEDIYLSTLYFARNLKYNKSYKRGQILRFFVTSLKWRLIYYLLDTYRPDLRKNKHENLDKWETAYTFLDFDEKPDSISRGELVMSAASIAQYTAEQRDSDNIEFSNFTPQLWQEFKEIAFQQNYSIYTREIIDAVEHGETLSTVAKRHGVTNSCISGAWCGITTGVAVVLRKRYPQFIKGESRRGALAKNASYINSFDGKKTRLATHKNAVLRIANNVIAFPRQSAYRITRCKTLQKKNLNLLVKAGYVKVVTEPLKVSEGTHDVYEWNAARTLEELTQELETGNL